MPNSGENISSIVPEAPNEEDQSKAQQESMLSQKRKEATTALEGVEDFDSYLDFHEKWSEYREIRSKFDDTNAYTERELHREYRKILETEVVPEFDENMLLVNTTSNKNIVLVHCTSPRLPEINKEEGHDKGNTRLRNVTTITEESFEDADTKTFHPGGADFIVIIRTENTDLISNASQVLAKASENQRPIEGTDNIPELVSAHTTMHDAVEAFNTMQKFRAETSLELTTSKEDAQKEVMRILDSMLGYAQEYRKAEYILKSFYKNCDEDYYNNFAQRYLEKVGIKSYAAAAELDANEREYCIREASEVFAKSGSLDSGGHYSSEVQQVFEQTVIEKVREQGISPLTLQDEPIDYNDVVREQIASSVDKVMNIGLNQISELMQKAEERITTISSRFQRRSGRKDTITENDLSNSYKDGRAAIAQVFTDIKNGHNLAENIPKYFELLEIPTAGAVNISKYTDELRDTTATERLQTIAGKELEIYNSRHDERTGLPDRFEYFKGMNDAIEQTAVALEKLNEKQAGKVGCGSVFIDLGYLSYFNREGGREIGNIAIEYTIAQIEQKLIDEIGSDWKKYVSIYRYAGDEFTIIYKFPPEGETVGGTSPIDGVGNLENKIKSALDSINERSKEVSSSELQKAKYIPERIQINFGFCSYATALDALGRLYRDDSKHEYLSDRERSAIMFIGGHPDYVNNELAKLAAQEMLSKTACIVADRIQNHQKTYARVTKIISRIKALDKIKDENRRQQERTHLVNLVNNYSGKSIYGRKYEFFVTVANSIGKYKDESAWDSFCSMLVISLNEDRTLDSEEAHGMEDLLRASSESLVEHALNIYIYKFWEERMKKEREETGS